MTLGRAQPMKTINGDLVGDLEVQSFTCTATSSIALSFNGFTTSSFSQSSTAAQVKAALEALPTIGLVTVSFDSGATVCSVAGVVVSITFLTEYGDQPLITSTSTGVGAASEDVKGSRMTYGTNYLSTTWDYNKVTGCLCDHDGSYNKSSVLSATNTGDILDWTGYDCSLRTCPHGNDPLSSQTKAREVQNITCAQTSGTFTVTFRQATTDALAYNINNAALETALEGLKTIGDVSISNSGDVACSEDGATSLVTFKTEMGDLPLMSGTATNGPIEFGESTKGTIDNVECSNRGVCDRVTGTCKCAAGYVSGDSTGLAAKGARGDCGSQDALAE